MKSATIKFLQSLLTAERPKSECDLLQFAIRCVRQHKVEENVENKVDWLPMFETLWKMYPRKVNKCLAKKTFEHKVRGLNEEECKAKCNQIYKVQLLRQKEWENSKRDLQYICHYSTFLNNEIPNSKYYKGV